MLALLNTPNARIGPPLNQPVRFVLTDDNVARAFANDGTQVGTLERATYVEVVPNRRWTVSGTNPLAELEVWDVEAGGCGCGH